MSPVDGSLEDRHAFPLVASSNPLLFNLGIEQEKTESQIKAWTINKGKNKEFTNGRKKKSGIS